MSALFCIDAHHREHVDEIGTFYTPIIVIGEIITICSPLQCTFTQPMHAKLLLPIYMFVAKLLKES